MKKKILKSDGGRRLNYQSKEKKEFLVVVPVRISAEHQIVTLKILVRDREWA